MKRSLLLIFITFFLFGTIASAATLRLHIPLSTTWTGESLSAGQSVSSSGYSLRGIFGLIGAIIAYITYESYIVSYIPSHFPIPQSIVVVLILLIGAFIARSFVQTTEDFISVGGPTILFVFSY